MTAALLLTPRSIEERKYCQNNERYAMQNAEKTLMLTPEGCRKRRQKLWDGLKEKPDWILLSAPQHLMYFANYYASPFTFRSQNAPALLVLGADGSSLLVADNLLQPYAEKAHVDKVVAPVWYRSRESAQQRNALLTATALEEMKTRKGDFIGIEPDTDASVIEGLRTTRRRMQTLDVVPHIHTMKRVKDPDELDILRRSMRATEAGFSAAIAGIKPGMTELQAYELVSQAAMNAVNEQAVVYGDFVSGPRTEEIGGPPSMRVIEKNDLVLLDFSVVLYGYRSDFANTFVVDGGKATTRQKELEQYCKEAMQTGERQLRAGADCRAIDTLVRNIFAMRHLGDSFPHHTGHGIGLGHPDPPYITPESTDSLLAGDVVTIEPGQYIKGVGGMRFERNYFISGIGYEVLSKHYIGLEPPHP
jgi:Xaa-Pro aminopeptidase